MDSMGQWQDKWFCSAGSHTAGSRLGQDHALLLRTLHELRIAAGMTTSSSSIESSDPACRNQQTQYRSRVHIPRS